MSVIQRIQQLVSKPPVSSVVLMYHRVASPTIDPWELSVSAANFEQQLQVLKQTGRVVSMPYFLEQLKQQKKPANCIVITFDDGYMDNYTTAKPLLEKYNLPATFFISTGHIGKKKEFWWDELAYILMQVQSLSSPFSISTNDSVVQFNLEEESELTETLIHKHTLWHYPDEPPTRRTQLYMELWALMSNLHYSEQQDILQKLRSWAGIEAQPQRSNTSMTEEQLLDLSKNSLFTIGAHTVTHPALDNCSAEKQNDEILKSKKYLESLIGSGVTLFAYPSGRFNETTINVLKQQGFCAAFTTNHQPVKEETLHYQLGRFQVNDWKGPVLKKKLSTWFKG